jgi:hypothetical protein
MIGEQKANIRMATTALTAVESVETLLRAKKLDGTLMSARPWSRDDREARLAPTGWPSVDTALGGGFPRGECSEIAGPASSGRTSIVCALMAAAGARGEVMALIDTLDCFDPVSAAAMGLDLSRLLWVRGTMLPSSSGSSSRSRTSSSDLLAQAIDRAIKSFGLVLQSGGFGVVALDLGDVPMRAVRRLPFTTWLRAQRLIEGRDTVGIVIAREPVARSARGVTVRLTGDGSSAPTWSGAGDRSRLFNGFTVDPQVASAHRLGRDGPLR